ncbi:serine/threonine protein kinase, partial [Streptomyces sp. SID685]|nr:serine/threonine protein kinase [Streptomyces sp. SID685]
GRTAWLGAGAAVVALAAGAYLVLADPFAGPLPDGWSMRPEGRLGATLAVPAGYQVSRPSSDDSDKNWVEYSDWSGAVSITLDLARKSEDDSGEIKNSARSQMYADDEEFRAQGEYSLDMPKGAKTRPDDTATYKGREAARNTVVYTTDDSQDPRPRELQVFYYRTHSGDMYQLLVEYPGKGDFTERGRQVAKAAIANLEVQKL